jgi:transposase InsO family protein
VPFEIISDNGSHFEGHLKETLEKYKVRHHQSSPYRPQTNGAVEAANKTIQTIIAKMTEKTREWPDKLPYALWGYRISIRTPTGTTPYSLVYGMEPVLPVEIEIQSLRVMNESEVSEDQWFKVRYDELALADERRLEALNNIQLYQRRIARAFNKRVRDRGIREGDLVLKENRAPIHDPRGKFKPNWSGPFLVKHITSAGAVKLVDLNGDEFLHFTNLDQLKKYYV